MFRPGSKYPPRIAISWLLLALLNDLGGLGEAVGNPAPQRLVNGTLGQSVTLTSNISEVEPLVITWDFRTSAAANKIPVCVKTRNNPADCNNELGERFRLNLNGYSLEIKPLIKSDQGLYEVNARSVQNVYAETLELRVYEHVSSLRIQISNVSSDGICNVTLSCSVKNGSDLIYSWWRGDEEVTDDGSHSVTDSGRRLGVSLSPHNTSTVYNCTVRNPVSEKTGRVDLAGTCNTGGDETKNYHKGLIAGIVIAISITIVIFIVWAWKKKHSKHDEAPNTEGTSEPALYAVIRRPSSARDQPQGHLCQLDANEGQQSYEVELVTIYDEIKFNPDVSTPTTAAKKGQEATANT